MPLKERNKNLIALTTSLGVHLAIMLLFLFLVSWKAPNPPLSAIGGIELNFGLDDVGSGETQPTAPVGMDSPVDTEEQNQPVAQDVTQSVTTEPEAEQLTSTIDDNPVEVAEAKPVKKEVLPEKPKKEVEAEKTKSTTDVDSPKQVEANQKKGSVGNHGDDKGKVGDKGSSQGTLDAKALYGNPGTGGQNGSGNGGGFALQMAGWTWDETPKAPRLPDNENGRVVFEIEVDEEGEITSIKTLERSLSPEAEKICKQEVLRRSLIKTSQGATPERSKGRVAFVLRTQ
jgi:periplasmic protein TonB